MTGQGHRSFFGGSFFSRKGRSYQSTGYGVDYPLAPRLEHSGDNGVFKNKKGALSLDSDADAAEISAHRTTQGTDIAMEWEIA